MLVQIQTTGTKPPLFFVHGLRGIAFSLGANFARALGMDQPVYVINANGVHGQELWKSDGTAAGTVLVEDINTDSGDSGRNEPV